MTTLNSERKLEIDAVLRCPHCGDTPYRVFRRQNQQEDGTLLTSFAHVLWPVHPNITPPIHPERIECSACRKELRRVAP